MIWLRRFCDPWASIDFVAPPWAVIDFVAPPGSVIDIVAPPWVGKDFVVPPGARYRFCRTCRNDSKKNPTCVPKKSKWRPRLGEWDGPTKPQAM